MNAATPCAETTQTPDRASIVECLQRSPPPLRPQDLHYSPIPPGARVMPAAVLVPLVQRVDGIHVLLTQRSAHLRDHPNQISFPGGRVEGGDENRIATALREAEEEIGLAPQHIDVLGTLPVHEMSSGFRIHPVVGWIEPPFDLTLDPFEVASAFEVPLAHFLDPANHVRRYYFFNNRDRYYLAMPYQGRYIWGATAGMLYSLYRQIVES
ncbi:MAG: CoA pyrophosphatase [Betaproteobacteria bacterium]